MIYFSFHYLSVVYSKREFPRESNDLICRTWGTCLVVSNLCLFVIYIGFSYCIVTDMPHMSVVILPLTPITCIQCAQIPWNEKLIKSPLTQFSNVLSAEIKQHICILQFATMTEFKKRNSTPILKKQPYNSYKHCFISDLYDHLESFSCIIAKLVTFLLRMYLVP